MPYRPIAFLLLFCLNLTLLAPVQAQTASQRSAASYTADVVYELKTAIAKGKMVFVGVGGEIDGAINPELRADVGDVVQINLINGDGAVHDIAVPDLNVKSEQVAQVGAGTTLAFRITKPGEFAYICTLPGHRQAGMEGRLVAGPKKPVKLGVPPKIVRNPSDVPPPIKAKSPRTVRIELEAVELNGELDDGTTYRYWTFNRTVPGPFVRVRLGDTVEVHLKNDKGSATVHSVDFHAVTGPGGGAEVTQAAPGEEKVFTFKALTPGLFVYHCATPMVAHHIANGMYGLILVEPAEGLPPVDREFYVMQGEIYTLNPFGARGTQELSIEKLLNERPEYFVFNGAVGALTRVYPMRARVGERIRIFFGVGGPNFSSSFHVIGEIFDKVYEWGKPTEAALRDPAVIVVPPGGGAIVEFKADVPGRYILVDHALSRVERGLVGYLQVEGDQNREIFKAGPKDEPKQ